MRERASRILMLGWTEEMYEVSCTGCPAQKSLIRTTSTNHRLIRCERGSFLVQSLRRRSAGRSEGCYASWAAPTATLRTMRCRITLPEDDFRIVAQKFENIVFFHSRDNGQPLNTSIAVLRIG